MSSWVTNYIWTYDIRWTAKSMWGGEKQSDTDISTSWRRVTQSVVLSWHWRRYVTWPVMLQRFGSGSNVSFQQSLLTLLIYRSIVTISLDHDLDNSKQSPNSNVKYWKMWLHFARNNLSALCSDAAKLRFAYRCVFTTILCLLMWSNALKLTSAISTLKIATMYVLGREKHQCSDVTQMGIALRSVFTTMCLLCAPFMWRAMFCTEYL